MRIFRRGDRVVCTDTNVALFKELIGKHGTVVTVGKPAEHFEDTPVFVEFDDDHTRFNLRPNELAFE